MTQKLKLGCALLLSVAVVAGQINDLESAPGGAGASAPSQQPGAGLEDADDLGTSLGKPKGAAGEVLVISVRSKDGSILGESLELALIKAKERPDADVILEMDENVRMDEATQLINKLRNHRIRNISIRTATDPAGAMGGQSATGLAEGVLLEETGQMEGAAGSYRAVIADFDKRRSEAANAVFRLAEIYRKQGKISEAKVFYSRVLREFPDQGEIAKLSHRHLFEPGETGADSFGAAGGFGGSSAGGYGTGSRLGGRRFSGGGMTGFGGGGGGGGFRGGTGAADPAMDEIDKTDGQDLPSSLKERYGQYGQGLPPSLAERYGLPPGSLPGWEPADAGKKVDDSKEAPPTDSSEAEQQQPPNSQDQTVGPYKTSGGFPTTAQPDNSVSPEEQRLRREISIHENGLNEAYQDHLEARRKLERLLSIKRAVEKGNPVNLPGAAGDDPRYQALKQKYSEALLVEGEFTPNHPQGPDASEKRLARWVAEIYLPEITADIGFAEAQYQEAQIAIAEQEHKLKDLQDELEAGTGKVVFSGAGHGVVRVTNRGKLLRLALSEISLKPAARLNKIEVFRPGSEGAEKITVNMDDVLHKGELDKDVLLKPGDVVHIPERLF